MPLSDQEIKDLGVINPFDENGLQSHSYDCKLHQIIKRQSRNYSNIWEDSDLATYHDHMPFQIQPGEFALASTQEVFTLPANVIGFVQGKSSIGRTGLQIENAGLIDPLFSGQITLEFFNASGWSVSLTEGMFICQIYFEWVTPATIKPYNKVGRYNNQSGPQIALKVGEKIQKT